jgi:hypothetical protein
LPSWAPGVPGAGGRRGAGGGAGGGGIPSQAPSGPKRKADALKAKEAGNDAYKRKDFPAAIQHYNAALELDDTDISFLTNRQAHA